MAINKAIILLLSMTVVLTVSACAHKSKVQPSKGHIDGQNTSDASLTSKSSVRAAGSIPKPVTDNIYLPPPKPKAKEPVYSIVVYDTPVKEVLFAIARDSKLNVDIHPSIQGKVTLNAVDQTLPAILERLSKQIDIVYKLEGNILFIKPDTPFLKSYSVNYVNMNRDTTGEVSVSNQIASSSISVSGSSTSGAGSSTATGGTGASNTSKTKVESISKNHFWDSLIDNITAILAESDKEVLVNRLASDSRLQGLYDARSQGNGSASVSAPGKNNGGGVAGVGDQNVQGSIEENSEKNLKNYKTLFAASVIPNKETGVLSVRATQKQHEKIQEFLDRVQSSAKRQVLIEASIVEIRLNDRYQAGVDWSRLGNGGALDGFTFRQDLLGTALTTAPRIAIGYNKATALGDLAASVRMLQTFGTTKVLSSPKLMVPNSQTAILKAVQNLVYFTVQTTPATLSSTGSVLSPPVTTTTPQSIPVGIWMSVTPQINENGIVTINVRPTISRKTDEVKDPNPDLTLVENKVPVITVREMESMLQVPSGSTVILGGLMQDEISNDTNGVPGLSNIPGIGNAFKAKDQSNTKTELVVFLRPTVIPNASLESDELATYKQYLPSTQLENIIDDNGER